MQTKLRDANAETLSFAIIGGFGHAICMFDELVSYKGNLIKCAGIAPAFEGESLSDFLSHPYLSGVRTFDSADTLIRLTTPDVLVVSTRPDHIHRVVLMGLEAGCHIIAEKPLALDLPALYTIQKAQRDAKRRLQLMLTMRTAPAFIWARKIVASGAIGKTVLVNTRKSYRWGNRPAWFNDRSKSGGIWPWIGIHNIDVMNFITGLTPVKVMAASRNAAHPEMPYCEDVSTAMLMLEQGAQMTASIDILRPSRAQTHGDDWIRIVGTGGIVEANGSTGEWSYMTESAGSAHGTKSIELQPYYVPFLYSLQAADIAIDALPFRLMAAALCAQTSIDCNQPVDIPAFDGHSSH